MAFMGTLLSLICLLSSALLLHSTVIHEGPESITLKLLHPFSVHSPFYPGENVTDVEKINLLIKATEARMHHLFPTTTVTQGNQNGGSSEVDDIMTPVENSGVYYVAQVGIGSFPPVPGPKRINYNLLMDTGSSTTWVQCEGCNPCFPLNQPNFQYTKSQSYKPIPCDDPTCPNGDKDCYGELCGFKLSYGGKESFMNGTIIREVLTFPSDLSGGATESYNNLFLGCCLESYNYPFKQNNEIGGLLGLGLDGPGTPPIWRQVGKQLFSYCLINIASEHATSQLYIGRDARLVGPQVQSTQLLRGSNRYVYYVDLLGISIAGVRLTLPDRSFSGGCPIDTGTPITSLVSHVYAIVKHHFVQYFAERGIQPYDGSSRPKGVPKLDLCFPKSSTSLPTMTFHFNGADLVLEPNSVFVTGKNYICLGLKSSKTANSIIGAHQQTQHRFSYELNPPESPIAGTLFFVPQNCGA